ncbi:MAG: zinc ribbon domain-containing protein [Rudaea sp.]
MPIYAFECTTCGNHFDRLQKLSDADPTVCPECGVSSVRRMVTAPSFRLAGSGWYETDFKKDGDKKRNLVDRNEGAKPESKSESSGGSGEAKSRDAKSSDAKPSESKKADAKPVEKKEKPAPKPKADS